MNERIKELYDAAQSSIDPMDQYGNVIERFSELIVKECADLTRWQEYDMSEEQRIRLEIYHNIKNHFGVE